MEENWSGSCKFVSQKLKEIKLHIEEKHGRIRLTKTHEIKLHIECNQLSHIYHMIMSSLHAEIGYVFQDFVFVSKGITWIFLSKKLHASHGYFFPSCTDC